VGPGETVPLRRADRRPEKSHLNLMPSGSSNNTE
jgi:hypothetical protein